MILGNIDFANALSAQGNKTAECVLEAGGECPGVGADGAVSYLRVSGGRECDL